MKIKYRTYPLTPMQEGMLFHKMLDSNSSQYILQTTVSIKGDFDFHIAQLSLGYLVQKHEALKTAVVVAPKTGKSWQVILEERTILADVIDLREYSHEAQKTKLMNIEKSDVQKDFDLKKDCLLRVKFIQLQNDEVAIIWTAHHIIIDGWCLNILVHDYFEIYMQLKERKEIYIYKPLNGYDKYLDWISKQDFQKGLAYWEDLLKEYNNSIFVMPIKKLYIEKNVTCAITEEFRYKITDKIVPQIVHTARKNYISVNTVIETVWAILLGYYNYTQDVGFLKVISGRNTSGINFENTVGLFVNTIPLRVQYTSKTKFTELLKQVQYQANNSMEYGYCPLASILRETGLRDQFTQMIYAFENYEFDDVSSDSLGGLQVKVENEREETNYPFSISFAMNDLSLDIKVLYDNTLYDIFELEQIIKRFEFILNQLTNNNDIEIGEICYIDPQEKCNIISHFNKEMSPIKYNNIIQAFKEQVHQFSNYIALTDGKKEISYKQLDELSDIVAVNLKELGIKKKDVVAIDCYKSIYTFVALFGVLKVGAVYVPIDLGQSKEQLNYILRDSKARLLLAIEFDRNIINDIDNKIINIQDIIKSNQHISYNVREDINAEDSAYIIYTSGTTGTPKGVVLKQCGVVNMRELFINSCNITPKDKILQFANLLFDASVSEWCMALLSGATLVVPTKAIIEDPFLFIDFMHNQKISIVTLPPNYYMQVASEIKPRVLITAGSDSTFDIVEKAQNIDIYINGYGPTETTVCATQWINYGKNQKYKKIPIGKPVINTQIYIMNDNSLCGIGVIGELCISGIGVAKEYINQEKLTKHKFIKNPYGVGNIYRSGDLARWLPDGNIEFLGRKDSQVKIRGFRIELSSIEEIIRELPEVKNVAVIDIEVKNEKALCAYIVLSQPKSIGEIREWIRSRLPQYMVPTYIYQIDNIPVNSSGKVDRKKLPKIYEIVPSEMEKGKKVVTNNLLQKYVLELFEDIIGIKGLGIHENFFSIGGDSIKVIRLVTQLKKAGYYVSVRDFMNHDTVEELANFIQNKSKIEEIDEIVVKDSITYPKFSLDKDNCENIIEDIICNYYKNFDKESIFGVYEPTDKQKQYLNETQILCSIFPIQKEVTMEQVYSAINNVIEEQSVLRTVADTGFTKRMIEYTKNTKWNIPIIDLENCSEKYKNLQQIISDKIAKKSKDNMKILSCIFIIKLSSSKWSICIYVDHCIWDARSFEIFQNRWKYYINGGEKETILPFSSFINMLHISDKTTLLEEYGDFVDVAKDFYKRTQKSKKKIRVKACHISEEENKADKNVLDNPYKFALEIFTTNILKSMEAYQIDTENLKEIPVFLVYHNRNQENQKVCGFFADVLPIILSMDKESTYYALEQQIQELQTGRKTLPHISKTIAFLYRDIISCVPTINLLTQVDVKRDEHLQENIETLWGEILEKEKYRHSLDLHMRIGEGKINITLITGENVEDMKCYIREKYYNNVSETPIS